MADVRAGVDPTLRNYATYIPIGDAVAKLWSWTNHGASISYLSSHRSPHDVATDAAVLEQWGFPPGSVLARAPGESYGTIAARELPDVLIEDDCESIGASEVTYPQIPIDTRRQIGSIVVSEFGGIDHLPDDAADVLRVATRFSGV